MVGTAANCTTAATITANSAVLLKGVYDLPREDDLSQISDANATGAGGPRRLENDPAKITRGGLDGGGTDPGLDLDLSKGYWQIPLEECSQAKTAFLTPWWLYKFVHVPFGLSGTTATFQRLMGRLLAPHQEFMAAYIDDVVVYSGSWKEHLQPLNAILQELQSVGLMANPKKCTVGQRDPLLRIMHRLRANLATNR